MVKVKRLAITTAVALTLTNGLGAIPATITESGLVSSTVGSVLHTTVPTAHAAGLETLISGAAAMAYVSTAINKMDDSDHRHHHHHHQVETTQALKAIPKIPSFISSFPFPSLVLLKLPPVYIQLLLCIILSFIYKII